VDGNSAAAGALADSTTVDRAATRGLDPEAALAAFDAGPLFTALGDSVMTGPTGNNLRDLRILLSE
jgi:hydroxypyruvate reductase